MRDFSSKVVVVTGAGSGIGRAAALAFAAAGAKLALVDWNAEALEATRADLTGRGAGEGAGDGAMAQSFSVADREAWEAFREAVLARFGTVDGILNNAGIAHEAVAVQHIDVADFERVMDVNFRGVLHGTQVFLPDLVTRPEAFVANVSSIYGVTAVGLQSAYCASKFAVRGLTEALRMEAAAYHPNLHVATVFPGGIDTAIAQNAITAGSRTPQEREDDATKFSRAFVTSPEKAAETILRGLRKRRPRIIIGNDARVMDWLARLRASGYTTFVLGQMRRKGFVDEAPPLPLRLREGGETREDGETRGGGER